MCSRNRSKQFISLAKECDLDAGKEGSKPEEKLEEVVMGGTDKESLTEEQPPEPREPLDGGMFKGGSRSRGVVKQEGGDDNATTTSPEETSVEEMMPEGSLATATGGGATTMEDDRATTMEDDGATAKGDDGATVGSVRLDHNLGQ